VEIVVNHLTRMRGDRICVAGIDMETGEHIRPVTRASNPLTTRLLTANGGPFAMGALVELGSVVRCGHPPETEDHRFSMSAAHRVKMLSPAQYVEALDIMSSVSLEDAFGPDLERASKWKYAVAVGSGTRSLAVLRLPRGCRLEVDERFERPKLTLRYTDVDPPAFVSVTDLRFFEADQRSVRRGVVNDVDARLRRGTDGFVMFGLTRPWDGDPDHHWLQVNGICLADRPIADAP
jgi:hypothetical protein